jgi:hypothetical protein
MSTDQIELWHKRARPSPTAADFNVQLGCHFEEIEEMMRSIKGSDYELWEDVRLQVLVLSKLLKGGHIAATITDRKELLDSLADQVVTGIGVGHCAGMKTAEAISRVNRSNYSKFDKNGYPIFNEQGKVMKGPDYAPPDLEGLY